MQLLGCSYTNIGPFVNKTLTFGFPQGSLLIKAPIGTGKSFLFFDGPIYGLYKYSPRPMLSATASEGYIQICFEHDDVVWCITRTLRQGKVKETCTSTLYKIEESVERIRTLCSQSSGFFSSQSLKQLLESQGIHFASEQFKNETDVQQYIDQILPPKEVILSTHILLQDAPNIFELPPAEKINVFKHVFGMLGIDEAKEQLADEKKEVQTLLKSHSNTTRFDELLRQYLTHLQTIFGRFEGFSPTYDWSVYKQWFSTLSLIDQEKLLIQNFSVEELNPEIIDGFLQMLQEKKQHYQQLQVTVQHQQSHLINLQQRKKEYEKKLQDLHQKIENLKVLISQFDIKKLDEIRNQSQKILEQKVLLESNYPQGIQALYEQIQQRISEGKECALHIQHQEKRIADLQEEKKKSEESIKQYSFIEGSKAMSELLQAQESYKHQQQEKYVQLERYLTSLQEKYQLFQQQDHQYQETFRQLQESLQQQSRFHCEKIQGECPFITHINERSLKQLQFQYQQITDQRQSLLQQLQDQKLEEMISQTQSQLLEYQKQGDLYSVLTLEQWRSYLPTVFEQYETRVQESHHHIQKIQEQLQSITQDKIHYQRREELKNLIQQYDRKKIQEDKQQLEIISKQLQEKDRELIKLQEGVRQYEEHQKLLLQYEIEQTTLIGYLKTLEDDIVLAVQVSDQTKDQIQSLHYENLEKVFQEATQFGKILQQLHQLVQEYKELQRTVLSLKEKETMIGNLYQIFSKELMLLVLEESLPTLSEIINNFLSQVAEYTLRFEMSKSSTDKLELECLVVDEKGERSIKSLSGGQKVLLKLTWILAIASYLKTSFLFLDETINNLDPDTIGKVAEMIKNFIHLHQLTFIVVTHSEQIQSLELRDQIMNLDTELKNI